MEREAMWLRQLWAIMFKELGTPVPSLTQFYVWLGSYPPRTVQKAIQSTLKKAFYMSKRGEGMNFAFQLNYAQKVMKMETQQEIEREYGSLEPEPELKPVPVKKPVINPFTGQPLLNPITGKPVVKEEN
jgi:hypothetical protein